MTIYLATYKPEKIIYMGDSAYFQEFIETVCTLSNHESIYLLNEFYINEIDRISWENCQLLKQALEAIPETELNSMYIETWKALIDLLKYAYEEEMDVRLF